MRGQKNVFQKYRLCLVLSVIAVVFVVSCLLFIKEGEESPIKEESETIEISDVYKVEHTEQDTDTEPMQESVVETEETVVTEVSVEPENVKTDTTEVEPDNVVSKAEAENLLESTAVLEPQAVPEPVPESVPEPERIPQEEQEPDPPAEEEKEIPSFQEQEESCHHSWVFESFYQEPTCSNGGLENQVCAHCGETQVTGGTPTGEHLYHVETQGDCCSEEVVVCTECNHREIKEKDMGNHIDVEDGFCYGCGENIK